MWKLTLEMVLSLASQFTIKPLAKTWPTWMRCESGKKKKPKLPCLINHFRLFRRHLGASGQFFIEMLFLTFGLLGLGLWYRSFPTPPQVLFTYSQPTKHFMPMMSLSKPSPYSHRTFNYILDVFKFKESLLHSFHLCSLSLHVVLSACTSLVAHQRKSILSILLWLPILTLPVSGTAVRQLSPFPCWWQGFVFFPATWESWF